MNYIRKFANSLNRKLPKANSQSVIRNPQSAILS